jgi:hypothetical protein
MSTNTTSTSDRVGADTPTSSPVQEEHVQKVQSASPFAVAIPDPVVIARLANEFFAALPGTAQPSAERVPESSSREVDLHSPPLFRRCQIGNRFRGLHRCYQPCPPMR